MAIRQWLTFEHDPVARDVSPNQCALAANARRRHHVNALKLCGPVGDADRAVVAPCSVRPPPLTTHRHLHWAVVSMTAGRVTALGFGRTFGRRKRPG